ncbi:hypothetical protein vseg_009622 [Gypsophila vaccaria]
MESYEASRTVFTRIQSIDPEHASKIMGYILLNHSQTDMLNFSYAPESLLLSLVTRAKSDLGISSNTFCASPVSNPISISRPNPLSLPITSPRLCNGFHSSSPNSPSIWSPHHSSINPNFKSSSFSSNGGLFGGSFNEGSNNVSYLDDFTLKDENLGSFGSDPVILPSKNVDFSDQTMDLPSMNGENSGGNLLHRRSLSMNESYLGVNEGNCMYYTRGYCKNGSNCKFVHEDEFGVGSPSNYEYDVGGYESDELLFRSKLAHQHRLAAHLMPFSKLGYLPSDAQRSAAALMMSEDLHKLNRFRMSRNEFAMLDCNPSSRQIYLTFPADSTFKEEDVSNYFNKFGPVQDVRIPYQQKRMFGFVTFVFPETVKIILAKGNPHFVCDSRVLVKPYKEKGKLPDKKQHQHQFERGEFSCNSPSSHDCREPYEFQLGGRMMYSTQEMLLRKKLEEQADFQHALELQERRLMNLQLLDLKSQQNQHNATVGSPISSNFISNGAPEESKASSKDEDDGLVVNTGVNDSNDNVQKKEDISPNCEENEFFESFDHVLPDNLFASPKKSSADIRPASFSPALSELNKGTSLTDSLSPAPSSLSMAPPKSCFLEMSRISNGHGAIGM